jgi:type IV pilus assembly protein PilZ
MPEKRKHLRVPIALAVLCEPVHGEPFTAITADFGLGGSRLESSEVHAFGTELVLSLRLPGSRDLSRLPAIVRWTKPNAFGVQFGPLGARDTKAIAELMAEAFHRD